MTDPRACRPLLVTTAFPCVQDPIQIPCQIQNAWSISLGILGLKIQLPLRPVDLPPLERADFAHSHAAIVGKGHGDLNVIGQCPSERKKVLVLKEA
jgi:hypothetical protein